MKHTLGVYLIVGAMAATAATAASDPVLPLGTVQRDEELRVECPAGWQLLYLDSSHTNPTCIYLDMVNQVGLVEVAKTHCTVSGAWLAEPEGWLHHEIYERILVMEYNQEGFWIGGSDQASEGVWIWERTGNPMPMGTPHWEHCPPSQPLVNDGNSNYACILPGDYYFFSCNNDSELRAMCQRYPTALKDAPQQGPTIHQETVITSTTHQ